MAAKQAVQVDEPAVLYVPAAQLMQLDELTLLVNCPPVHAVQKEAAIDGLY